MYLLTTGEKPALALGTRLNVPKGTWEYGPIEVEKGAWNDVLFNIGWSTGDDGFVEAWVNDQSLTMGPVHLRTLYYSFTDYLKLGLYRCAPEELASQPERYGISEWECWTAI
jgi:hypothetical protein